MRALRTLLIDEGGTTAVEYAVMLGLILLVAIAGISTFGQGSGGIWGNNSSQLGSAMGS